MSVDTPVVGDGERVILFDGVCKLCNGWANFIISHDPELKFQLASVQSSAGQLLLTRFNYPTDQFDTMLLVEHGCCFEKTEAFFKIVSRLGFPWRLLLVFRLLPRAVRDWLYDRIARNRYRLFGRYDYCRLPDPDHHLRYLNNER